MSEVDTAFVQSLKDKYGEKWMADKEKDQVWSPERAIPKVIEGATLGTVDIEGLGQGNAYVKDGQMYYKGVPIGSEFITEEGQSAGNAADMTALILGSFAPYAAISTGIKVGLAKLSKGTGTSAKIATQALKVTEQYPVLSEVIGYNLAEEVAEYGIRKSTGQEYTKEDFLQGLAMGGVMGGA